MLGLFMCALLTTQVEPQNQPPRAAADSKPPIAIDGSWTILCLEKNGQAVVDAKNATVTIRNNVITCDKEKSGMKSLRLEFGPQATVRVTEMGDRAAGTTEESGTTGSEKPKPGVYVVGRDFLSICVHEDKPALGGTAKADSHCTIFLKRTSAKD